MIDITGFLDKNQSDKNEDNDTSEPNQNEDNDTSEPNIKPDSPDFDYTSISYFWIFHNNHPAGRYIASGRYIIGQYIASILYW